MPLKVWYSSLGQSSLPLLSPKMCDSVDSQGGRVVLSRRLNRGDMRQTVRVTDKQPWSLGATSRERHCLGADNKLQTRLVIAAHPVVNPTETSILKSLKGMSSQSVPDMWLSQVCLINFGIYDFDFCWFLNVSPWGLDYSLIERMHVCTAGGKCLFMHVTSRALVWIIPHLHARHLYKVICPATSVYALSVRGTWCISI